LNLAAKGLSGRTESKISSRGEKTVRQLKEDEGPQPPRLAQGKMPVSGVGAVSSPTVIFSPFSFQEITDVLAGK